VSNVQRWVQRVDGVARVHTDLNTGQASVWFEHDKKPTMGSMWDAVKSVGYQPTKITSGDQVYEGPKP